MTLASLLCQCRQACDNPLSNQLRVQCKSSRSQSDTLVAFTRIWGVGRDTLTRQQVISAGGRLTLPVNAQADSVSYVLEYVQHQALRRDTFTIAYRRRVYLARPNCGLLWEVSNLQFSKTTLDSAAIANTGILLNTPPKADVLLYF